jgi:hypothetical protein
LQTGDRIREPPVQIGDRTACLADIDIAEDGRDFGNPDPREQRLKRIRPKEQQAEQRDNAYLPQQDRKIRRESYKIVQSPIIVGHKFPPFYLNWRNRIDKWSDILSPANSLEDYP